MEMAINNLIFFWPDKEVTNNLHRCDRIRDNFLMILSLFHFEFAIFFLQDWANLQQNKGKHTYPARKEFLSEQNSLQLESAIDKPFANGMH